jgi:hypothetical protein
MPTVREGKARVMTCVDARQCAEASPPCSRADEKSATPCGDGTCAIMPSEQVICPSWSFWSTLSYTVSFFLRGSHIPFADTGVLPWCHGVECLGVCVSS